jgi:hypothetical protein
MWISLKTIGNDWLRWPNTGYHEVVNMQINTSDSPDA